MRCHGRFCVYCDGRRMCISDDPLRDTARGFLKAGVPPNVVLIARHDFGLWDVVTTTLGAAAQGAAFGGGNILNFRRQRNRPQPGSAIRRLDAAGCHRLERLCDHVVAPELVRHHKQERLVRLDAMAQQHAGARLYAHARRKRRPEHHRHPRAGIHESNYSTLSERVELQWQNGLYLPLRTPTGPEQAARPCGGGYAVHAMAGTIGQPWREPKSKIDGQQFRANRVRQNQGSQSRTLGRDHFADALDRLVEAGQIAAEPYGAASRGTARIVRKGVDMTLHAYCTHPSRTPVRAPPYNPQHACRACAHEGLWAARTNPTGRMETVTDNQEPWSRFLISRDTLNAG